MNYQNFIEYITEKYSSKILSWAVKKTENRFEAEDLTQDIFLQVFIAVSETKKIEKPEHFIWKVAYHCWCNRLRDKMKKNNLIELKESIQDDFDFVDEWILNDEQKENITKIRQKISNIQNSVTLGGIFYFVIISGYWWIFPLGIIMTIPSFYFNKKRVEYGRQVWNQNNTNMRYSDYLNNALLNREASKERRIFQFAEYLSEKWDIVFKKYNKEKINTFIKSSVATGIAMCFSMSVILIFGLLLLFPLKSYYFPINI